MTDTHAASAGNSAPVAIDHAGLTTESVQAMIRKAAEETDQKLAHEVDALKQHVETVMRDAVRTAIRDQDESIGQMLESRLKPLAAAIDSRTTPEQARQIANEQIAPVQGELATLRKEITALAELLRPIAVSLPERLGRIEGQISAFTSMRSTQDEERQRQIAQIDAKADATQRTLDSFASVVRPGLQNIQNDLYGVPGGAAGVIALTHQNHQAITALTALSTRWDAFMTRFEQSREADAERLRGVEAFVESERARRARWMQVRASVAGWVAKSTTNKLVAVVITALGGLSLTGLLVTVGEFVVKIVEGR